MHRSGICGPCWAVVDANPERMYRITYKSCIITMQSSEGKSHTCEPCHAIFGTEGVHGGLPGMAELARAQGGGSVTKRCTPKRVAVELPPHSSAWLTAAHIPHTLAPVCCVVSSCETRSVAQGGHHRHSAPVSRTHGICLHFTAGYTTCTTSRKHRRPGSVGRIQCLNVHGSPALLNAQVPAQAGSSSRKPWRHCSAPVAVCRMRPGTAAGPATLAGLG